MKNVKLLILVIVCFAMGCSSAGESFVSTVRENDKLFLQDLKTYIEKDETLAQKSKELRIRSIDEHLKMIEAEWERIQKE